MASADRFLVHNAAVYVLRLSLSDSSNSRVRQLVWTL